MMAFLQFACASTVYRDRFQFTARIVIELEKKCKDMIALAPPTGFTGAMCFTYFCKTVRMCTNKHCVWIFTFLRSKTSSSNNHVRTIVFGNNYCDQYVVKVGLLEKFPALSSSFPFASSSQPVSPSSRNKLIDPYK